MLQTMSCIKKDTTHLPSKYNSSICKTMSALTTIPRRNTGPTRQHRMPFLVVVIYEPTFVQLKSINEHVVRIVLVKFSPYMHYIPSVLKYTPSVPALYSVGLKVYSIRSKL
jgi:hypothetical protein